MGTGGQAYWFKSRFRFRWLDVDEGEPGPWLYGAETMADIDVEIAAEVLSERIEVQRRVREDYVPYTFIDVK